MRGIRPNLCWCTSIEDSNRVESAGRKRHRHDPVKEQQKTLNAKLRGHYQYYGRPTNYRSIGQFYRRVQRIWKEWLGRRTRGKRLTWERFKDILRQFPLLLPRITQAWAGAGSHA
jgi:RNA-directed DNA polymerase